MNWKNLPIPETIAFPLLVGMIINYLFPQQIFPHHTVWMVLAGILFTVGFIWIIWSVREVGKTGLAASESLIISGPYRFSRNPMYLSWLLISLGVFLVNRSIWLLALSILGFLLTHFLVILREEKNLEEEFGEQFEAYCQKVRRYI